jgi:plasmid stabilization system protein ParE
MFDLAWWREHRLAAPALVAEELAAALELIATSPRIGRRRRHPGVPGLRRVLLRTTRYHLYYAPSTDGTLLFVLAVWSALRGGPPIRSPLGICSGR